jgi:hopanoid-associated phosphorylase
MAFEAGLFSASDPAPAVVYGLRGASLLHELARRLATAPAAGVLSFGVAGGLDPGLPPGTLIVADGIHGPNGQRFATDPGWTAALRAVLPQARAGWLAAGDDAVAAVAAKAALRRDTGALAVDMESHAAGQAAQAAGVPFAVCRVVIDPATRAVPAAAMAAMGADGKVDMPALLRSLLRDPAQIAGLLRLARDASAARAALQAAQRQAGGRFALQAHSADRDCP